MTRALVLLVLLAGCDRTESKPPPPPPPPAPAPAYDTSCVADEDCVPAPSCCPPPCTENVINRKEAERARAAMSCPADQKCVAAGSCLTHAYLCMDKTCKLVYSNQPGYRGPKND